MGAADGRLPDCDGNGTRMWLFKGRVWGDVLVAYNKATYTKERNQKQNETTHFTTFSYGRLSRLHIEFYFGEFSGAG